MILWMEITRAHRFPFRISVLWISNPFCSSRKKQPSVKDITAILLHHKTMCGMYCLKMHLCSRTSKIQTHPKTRYPFPNWSLFLPTLCINVIFLNDTTWIAWSLKCHYQCTEKLDHWNATINVLRSLIIEMPLSFLLNATSLFVIFLVA